MTIRLSRAYEEPGRDDGRRVLVDRVWPRGRSRASLMLDAWYPELGPTNALRKWFGHDPARWAEFRARYLVELTRPEVEPLLEGLVATARSGTLTLVYGAADREHNQAVVLAELIRERAGPEG